MKTENNYKCLFVANSGYPGEKIGFKSDVGVEELKTYIKDSFLGQDFIKMNCNKDTVLIPGQFENRQNGVKPIDWQKVEIKESLFQKQEIIPVILKGFAGRIYYIANMNQDAFNNTIVDGKLWVYSKTNGKLQQKGVTSGDCIDIKTDSFNYGIDNDGKQILKVDCFPVNTSVCHKVDQNTGKGYETCFFRGIEEVMKEIKIRISSIPSI